MPHLIDQVFHVEPFRLIEIFFQQGSYQAPLDIVKPGFHGPDVAARENGADLMGNAVYDDDLG
jgi:hypothetical protein